MPEHDPQPHSTNCPSNLRRGLAALTLTGTVLGGASYSSYAEGSGAPSARTHHVASEAPATPHRQSTKRVADMLSILRLPQAVSRDFRRLPLPTHMPPSPPQPPTSPSTSPLPTQPLAAQAKAEDAPQDKWFGSEHYKANIQTADEWHNVALAYELARKRRWFSIGQVACLDNLWSNESHFDEHEINSSSGAYGIPQALPGEKMASAGDDWHDNPATQMVWGLQYIEQRYETPCGAWGHETDIGWY